MQRGLFIKSTDRSIDILAAVGLAILALTPFLSLIGLTNAGLVVAAGIAMYILARAWWLEEIRPRQTLSTTLTMAGNPRLKQGVPTNWDGPPEPAPSIDAVVAENIAYARSKRRNTPPSIKEIERAEDITYVPPWIENPGTPVN